MEKLYTRIWSDGNECRRVGRGQYKWNGMNKAWYCCGSSRFLKWLSSYYVPLICKWGREATWCLRKTFLCPPSCSEYSTASGTYLPECLHRITSSVWDLNYIQMGGEVEFDHDAFHDDDAQFVLWFWFYFVITLIQLLSSWF